MFRTKKKEIAKKIMKLRKNVAEAYEDAAFHYAQGNASGYNASVVRAQAANQKILALRA